MGFRIPGHVAAPRFPLLEALTARDPWRTVLFMGCDKRFGLRDLHPSRDSKRYCDDSAVKDNSQTVTAEVRECRRIAVDVDRLDLLSGVCIPVGFQKPVLRAVTCVSGCCGFVLIDQAAEDLLAANLGVVRVLEPDGQVVAA